MNIEISYAILYSIVIITLILTITRKMSMGIGIVGIGLGLGIAYILAPYMSIVIEPLGQALFYGATWTIPAYLGAGHLITLLGLVGMAVYNLLSSGGKIIWA